MPSEKNKLNRIKLIRKIGFSLLCLLLLLLFFFSYSKKNDFLEQEKNKFNGELDRYTYIIQTILHGYVHGLQGTAGLYVVNKGFVSKSSFELYAKSRGYFNNFKGSLGYGFIRNVRDLNKYVKDHKKNNPDFTYRKLSDTKHENFIIELIEPVTSNKAAVGLDIASEKNRYEAATLARDSGEVVMTSRITLVQVNSNTAGLLIFLPVYSTGTAPSTVAEKRKNLIGWAYTPIVVSNLIDRFRQVINTNLTFNLFEENEKQNILLYKNSGAALPFAKNEQEIFSRKIHFGKKVWIIESDFNLFLNYRLVYIYPLFIFLIGSIFLLLLAYFSNKILIENERSLISQDNIESWQRAIFASTTFAIFSTTTTGLLNFFNRKAENLLGYSAEDVINLKSPIVFHKKFELKNRLDKFSKDNNPAAIDAFQAYVESAKKNGIDIQEFNFVRKDKTTFPGKLTISPIINSNNVIIGYLGVVEDLTLQKEAQKISSENQAKLIVSAKMSSLGELAGSIAHEINTPLSVIKMRIKKILIMFKKQTLDQEEARRDLESLDNTIDKIAKIILALKKFTRNASNDELETVRISSILEDALELTRERIKFNSIEFNVNKISDANINCRPVEICQVIVNLISNAIDATLNLKNKIIKVEITSDTNFVYLRVSDSGSGINPEILDKIFNPFFTTKPAGMGTGLGLSISLEIIKRSGGRLYYDNHEGSTRFTIEMPIISQ